MVQLAAASYEGASGLRRRVDGIDEVPEHVHVAHEDLVSSPKFTKCTSTAFLGMIVPSSLLLDRVARAWRSGPR